MDQIQMNNVERWSRQINVRDMIDKSRVLITKKNQTARTTAAACVSQTRYAAATHDVFVHETTDGRRSAFGRCTARTRVTDATQNAIPLKTVHQAWRTRHDTVFAQETRRPTFDSCFGGVRREHNARNKPDARQRHSGQASTHARAGDIRHAMGRGLEHKTDVPTRTMDSQNDYVWLQ